VGTESLGRSASGLDASESVRMGKHTGGTKRRAVRGRERWSGLCVRHADRTLRWKTRVSDDVMPHARRFFSTPRVAADRVYLGAADGNLYSLDGPTWQLRWKYNCGDWVRSRPTVFNDVVCAATLDGKLIAVRDGQTHAQPLWTEAPSRFSITADLESDEQGVLASTSDFDLMAYDWRDGREQWRVSLIDCSRDGELKVFADSMPEIMQAPVIVADGMVLFCRTKWFCDRGGCNDGASALAI